MAIKNKVFKKKIENNFFFKDEGSNTQICLLSSCPFWVIVMVSGLWLVQASPLKAMEREVHEDPATSSLLNNPLPSSTPDLLNTEMSSMSPTGFYKDAKHPLTQEFWKNHDISDRLKSLTDNIGEIKEKIVKSNYNLLEINYVNIVELLRCYPCNIEPVQGLSDIKFVDLLLSPENQEKLNNGFSGADVSRPLPCNNTKVVIKRFNDKKKGLKELLHSLIALELNPSPAELKMARIYDATICSQNSEDCLSIIMECAKGQDINTCLSTLSADAVKACAEYLAMFHIRNHQKLTETIDRKKYIDHIANAFHTLLYDPLKEEEGEVKLLDLSVGKTSPYSEEVKSDNIIRSLRQEKQEKFKAFVKESCDQLKNNTYKIFESQAAENQKPYFLTITHGDAHGKNFFYDDETSVQDLFKRITMIDFESIIRTYGDIGDPAEDVGRFLGSLWEWAAQKSNLESEHIEEELEKKINHLQNGFIQSYLDIIRKDKNFTEEIRQDFEKTFKENYNFYKLRFYRVIFNSKQDRGIKLKILNSWMKENSDLKTSSQKSIQKNMTGEESEDRDLKPVKEAVIHHNLPEKLEVFIESVDKEKNKSYLTLLREKLHQTGTATLSTKTLSSNAAIAGMGGVGKTSLALEYAHEALKNNDYNLIYWLSSGTKDSLLEGYKKLLWEMNIPTEGVDKDGIIDLVKKEVCKKDKCLLIYDNVPQFYGDVSAPIFFKTNTPKHTHILITSRLDEGWVSPINLDVFRRQDSIEYLLKITNLAPIPDHKEIAGDLANELGHLPLALAHAAHYIKLVGGKNVSKKTFEEYLRDFKNLNPLAYLEENKDPFKNPKSEITYENLIARTLCMSEKYLIEKGIFTLAKDLLAYCSYLDPDSIMEEIFLKYWPNTNQDPEKIKEVLETLSSLSLIKKIKEKSSFSIHSLIQLVIRNETESKENNMYPQTVLNVASFFIELFKKNFRESKKIDNFLNNNLSHIVQLLQHSKKIYIKFYEQNIPKCITSLIDSSEPLRIILPLEIDNLEWLERISHLIELNNIVQSNLDCGSDKKMRAQYLKKMPPKSLKAEQNFTQNSRTNDDPPDWLIEIAKHSPVVQYALSLVHGGGGYGRKDDEKSFYWCKKAANNGYAPAQYTLGLRYADGVGVPSDSKEKKRWHKAAAKQGFAAAQNELGLIYEDQNCEKAMGFYGLAAKKGFATSQYNLGRMYCERGLCALAIDYYNLAVDQEYAPAQFMLGLMSKIGMKSVPQDTKKAIELFTKAANQEHAEAQNNLQMMYKENISYKLALDYYSPLANQGDASAQYNLGNMYQNGVKPSNEEAAKWYKRAALQKFAAAQNKLGDMYQNGHGVNKDRKLAIEYYTLAAEQGFVLAQNNLGKMYEDNKHYQLAAHYYALAGLGIPQNVEKALELYKSAAEHWDTQARDAFFNIGGI